MYLVSVYPMNRTTKYVKNDAIHPLLTASLTKALKIPAAPVVTTSILWTAIRARRLVLVVMNII